MSRRARCTNKTDLGLVQPSVVDDVCMHEGENNETRAAWCGKSGNVTAWIQSITWEADCFIVICKKESGPQAAFLRRAVVKVGGVLVLGKMTGLTDSIKTLFGKRQAKVDSLGSGNKEPPIRESEVQQGESYRVYVRSIRTYGYSSECALHSPEQFSERGRRSIVCQGWHLDGGRAGNPRLSRRQTI